MIFYYSVADRFAKDLFHIHNLQKQLQQHILVIVCPVFHLLRKPCSACNALFRKATLLRKFGALIMIQKDKVIKSNEVCGRDRSIRATQYMLYFTNGRKYNTNHLRHRLDLRHRLGHHHRLHRKCLEELQNQHVLTSSSLFFIVS